MKTTILKSAALIAIFFAGALNSAVNAANLEGKGKENVATAKTIYAFNEEKKTHLRFDYAYDADSRILSKEAFRWNAGKQSWTPCYRSEFTYTCDNIIMEFSRWNPQDEVYNLLRQKNVYNLNSSDASDMLLTYRWDKRSKSWKEVKNQDIENNGKLFAEER